MIVTKAERIKCSTLNGIARHHAQSLVSLAETAYAGSLSLLCKDLILQHRNIVFITGPSGSGKTTTALRLMALLRENGKRAVGISLDNFYLPREQIPFWEGERRNYETIDALDLAEIARCADELRRFGRTHLPVFNFAKGGRQLERAELRCDAETFLVVEGIHALNPRLTGLFDTTSACKVYVSAHTDFVDDEGAFILMAQELRLVRRLLRDLTERNVPIDETLDIWDDVCRGERAYIRPFRGNADVHINSTHCYEPLLYKPFFTALMEQQQPDPKFASLIDELLGAFAYFDSISASLLPENSLLREFLPHTDPPVKL